MSLTIVRYKIALCFVALGQVVGLSLLFLGIVGNLELNLHQEQQDNINGDDTSKHKIDYKQVIDPETMPNQVVLIIVDALRVDMMTPTNFPFLLTSLKNHKKTGVLLYNVTVDSPTVTLPRVKTMMTGKAPTYLDILKNLQTSDNSLSSNLLTQDNIIKLLRENRNDLGICFFGDETWLRLFPADQDGTSKFFQQSEGVTSFFVKDFHEVDNNVTRNLNNIQDCKFLILHYLGLDHIGHVYGPTERPDLIKSKLKEMDKVIQKIYNRISKLKGHSNKSVIIVTGDHGMANVGGHGGSSYEEITTPLAAVITSISHMKNLKPIVSSINQVDIAPTLAALWRLRMPEESQGKLILEIVESFQSSQTLAHTYEDNCKHLMKMLGEARIAATYRLWFNEISKLEKPLSIKKYIELENELAVALRSLRQEQGTISGHYVLIGVVLLIIVEGVAFFLTARMLSVVWNGANYAVILSILPPLLIYFSSSFIEEEHYIRYFIFSCVMLNLYWYNVTDYMSAWKLLKVLFYHRILTTFNQTGDKWSHIPDINDIIIWENLTWLSALIGTILVWRFLVYSGRDTKLCAISLGLTWWCKIVNKSEFLSKLWPFSFFGEVGIQQITFLMILFHSIITLWRRSARESIFTGILLVVLHLQRQQNILVVGLLLTGLLELISFFHHHQMLKLESQTNLSKVANNVPLSTQVAFVWFAHNSFFYQGNSNGLATIDVSAGYIGLGSFASNVLIAIFIFLNTYGNPFLVYLHFASIRSDTKATTSNNSTYHVLSNKKPRYRNKISNPLPVISLLSNGVECIIYSVTLLMFSNHLFICNK
ncbi:GPI ethanolamine phosphate transferase 2 [Folsomia candida]|uniref:GPI ethanolamine phosphate transferase 2 n=1 Tax=Folsomia candida TaxID=158441 RepID=A0A226EHD8_FOLCA|nr:GPI ethanolamine phosphate transferase 2 [Folsomia candida]